LRGLLSPLPLDSWQASFHELSAALCPTTRAMPPLALPGPGLARHKGSQMPIISPVKGTRDFYPDELAFRRWLYDQLRVVSESFGYQEYDAPFLERLELYAAKSGEELVKEQSFVFPDRSGELIALRPELTPSLARMIAQRSKALPRPVRWWSFGPFWRYERPQRGRTREFFQWNIDLLGIDSPNADAEIVAVAAAFFRQIGLSANQIKLHMNDRRLAEALLSESGIPQGNHQPVFRLIDRRERMSAGAWKAYAAELGLGEEDLDSVQQILDNPDSWKQSPALTAAFESLGVMGFAEYVRYDPAVVRGLDYYTGIVFEARDVGADERAVLGGGRYDNLVGEVGGDPVPGVGFAMGDVVIGLLLERQGAAPQLRSNPAQVLVTTFDEASIMDAIGLAQQLRDAGLRTEWYPQPDRMAKQLKYADRYGIPLVVILGPDELSRGQVAVKDLRTGDQTSLPRRDIPSALLGLASGDASLATGS
jgi:histidyl-tRNA synthetase